MLNFGIFLAYLSCKDNITRHLNKQCNRIRKECWKFRHWTGSKWLC